MIEVTEEAREELLKYLEEKPGQGIRIFIQGYGWGGPRMGMALDEPRDTDQKFNVEGLEILVSQEDSDYILAGAGVKVARTNSPYGSGFYVVKQGMASSSCC